MNPCSSPRLPPPRVPVPAAGAPPHGWSPVCTGLVPSTAFSRLTPAPGRPSNPAGSDTYMLRAPCRRPWAPPPLHPWFGPACLLSGPPRQSGRWPWRPHPALPHRAARPLSKADSVTRLLAARRHRPRRNSRCWGSALRRRPDTSPTPRAAAPAGRLAAAPASDLALQAAPRHPLLRPARLHPSPEAHQLRAASDQKRPQRQRGDSGPGQATLPHTARAPPRRLSHFLDASARIR